MSNAVRVVARAMFVAFTPIYYLSGGSTPAEDASDADLMPLYPIAEAAIIALREPTEQMIAAGEAEFASAFFQKRGTNPKAIWDAMYAVLVKEK